MELKTCSRQLVKFTQELQSVKYQVESAIPIIEILESACYAFDIHENRYMYECNSLYEYLTFNDVDATLTGSIFVEIMKEFIMSNQDIFNRKDGTTDDIALIFVVLPDLNLHQYDYSFYEDMVLELVLSSFSISNDTAVQLKNVIKHVDQCEVRKVFAQSIYQHMTKILSLPV